MGDYSMPELYERVVSLESERDDFKAKWFKSNGQLREAWEERDKLLAEVEIQEKKYEGYLQKLRDDWKADSDERAAYIKKIEAIAGELAEASRNFVQINSALSGMESYKKMQEKIASYDHVSKEKQ